MTTHSAPVPHADRSAEWSAAVPFEAWLAQAEDLVELWTSSYERARVPDGLVGRAEAAPGDWRLLVVMADWCLDATAAMPALARLAEEAEGLSLAVLDRDDHPALMDHHLTNGTARAIPIVLLLDGEGTERAWWGPRPADLQAWFYGDGQTLEKEDRYRELRKWYARDRGASTLREVVAMIEGAAGVAHVA